MITKIENKREILFILNPEVKTWINHKNTKQFYEKLFMIIIYKSMKKLKNYIISIFNNK